MTNPSWPSGPPAVVPVRKGHRRRFSEAEKRQILKETAQPGASTAIIARQLGIDRRILCRWKQELAVAEPAFVTVEITDLDASVEACAR